MSRKIFVLAVVAFVVFVGGVAFIVGGKPRPIFPGMAAARYRFPPGRPSPLDKSIVALEVRTRGERPSALDLSELAALYFRQGHLSGDLTWYDKAAAVAKRSLHLLPFPNSSTLVLAKLADAEHRFSEAIGLAEEALKDNRSKGALAVLVSAHLAQGNLTEAARYADRAVDVQPELGTYLMRALVLTARGRDEEAAFDFQRAVAVEDIGDYAGSARLRALWGRFLTRRGEYQNAQNLFAESLRILPGNPLALSLQGELELKQGHYASAQKSLMAAFTASKQLRFLIHYARAKALAGDAKAAADVRAMAEKLVRDDLQGGRFGHRLELVELLLDRGQPTEMAEAVEAARAELKVRQSAEAHYFLAKSLLASGRPEEAIEPIREVLRTGVKDPEYFALAASIERSRGNAPRAGLYRSLAQNMGS